MFEATSYSTVDEAVAGWKNYVNLKRARGDYNGTSWLMASEKFKIGEVVLRNMGFDYSSNVESVFCSHSYIDHSSYLVKKNSDVVARLSSFYLFSFKKTTPFSTFINIKNIFLLT